MKQRRILVVRKTRDRLRVAPFSRDEKPPPGPICSCPNSLGSLLPDCPTTSRSAATIAKPELGRKMRRGLEPRAIGRARKSQMRVWRCGTSALIVPVKDAATVSLHYNRRPTDERRRDDVLRLCRGRKFRNEGRECRENRVVYEPGVVPNE